MIPVQEPINESSALMIMDDLHDALEDLPPERLLDEDDHPGPDLNVTSATPPSPEPIPSDTREIPGLAIIHSQDLALATI